MNLLRIAIAFIVIWLLVRMYKGYRTRARLDAMRRSRDRGIMVPCARCGIHVPRAEAHRRGERYYCSKEHAIEGEKDDP